MGSLKRRNSRLRGVSEVVLSPSKAAGFEEMVPDTGEGDSVNRSF